MLGGSVEFLFDLFGFFELTMMMVKVTSEQAWRLLQLY